MSILKHTNNYGLTLYQSLFELPTYLKHYSDDMVIIDTNLADHGQRIARMENIISTVSSQNIEDLQSRLGALENKVQTNTSNIHELNDNMSDVEGRLTTDENNISSAVTRITTVEGRVTTLEDCCVHVQDRLTATELATSKNADDISGIMTRLTRDEANIQGNSDDIVILSEQVATNAHNIDDLTHALGDLDPTSNLEVVRQVAENTTAIGQLQALTTVHTQRLDGFATRFTQDEVRITDLERRMTEAESALEQVGDWQTQIDTLTDSVNDLVDVQMPALTTLVNGYDDRITALETWKVTVDTYMSDTDSVLTAYDGRLDALESADTLIEGRLNSAENDIAVIQQTITTDEAALTALTDRVSDVEDEIGDTDISTYGNTLTSAISEAFSRVANLVTTKQDKIQYTTMPTAGVSNEGMIVQYSGVSNANYTNGYWYRCEEVSSDTYEWVEISTQKDVPMYDVMPSDAELFAMDDGTIFFTYGYYNKLDNCGGYYLITNNYSSLTGNRGGLKKEYNNAIRVLFAIDNSCNNKGMFINVCRYGVREYNDDMSTPANWTKANTYAQLNSDIINNIYFPYMYDVIFKFPRGNFFFADTFNPQGGVNNEWAGVGIKGEGNSFNRNNPSAQWSATRLIFPFLANGDYAINVKNGVFEDFELCGNPLVYDLDIDRSVCYTNPSGVVLETIAEENGEQIKCTGMNVVSVGLVRNVHIVHFYMGMHTQGNRYFTDISFHKCHIGCDVGVDVKIKGIYGWYVYDFIHIHGASLISIVQGRVDSCVHAINIDGNLTNSTFIDIDGDFCAESAIDISGWKVEGNKFIAVGGRCCACKAYDSVNDTPPDVRTLANTEGYGVVRFHGEWGSTFKGNYFNLRMLAVGNPFDTASDIKIPNYIAFTCNTGTNYITDNVFEVTGVTSRDDILKGFQTRANNFTMRIDCGIDTYYVNGNTVTGVNETASSIDTRVDAIEDCVPSGAGVNNKFATMNDVLLPKGMIVPYGGNSAPTGWLMCDGSAVSRDTYSELFNVIGTAFGNGDGSTTFNLPDLRNKTTFGVGNATGGLANVGAVSVGSLPNISGNGIAGRITARTSNMPETNGALKIYPNDGGSTGLAIGNGNADWATAGWFDIDASRVSSIYKSTSQVVPASVGVNYIIRA